MFSFFEPVGLIITRCLLGWCYILILLYERVLGFCRHIKGIPSCIGSERVYSRSLVDGRLAKRVESSLATARCVTKGG